MGRRMIKVEKVVDTGGEEVVDRGDKNNCYA